MLSILRSSSYATPKSKARNEYLLEADMEIPQKEQQRRKIQEELSVSLR